MKKLNIQKEAKKPKYVEIGDGFYVNKVGKDPNGNSCVWVQKGEGRSKKIQLVGVIPNKKDIIADGIEFFQDKNDPDTKKSVDALKEYYKKHLMKEKKSSQVVGKTADVEELTKSEITLTRDKGFWKAWYRGKSIGKDKDLTGIQKKIDKFVKIMVENLKE